MTRYNVSSVYLQIKYKNAELDVTFSKNCQAYNVHPKLLAFNIAHSNTKEEKNN